MAPATVYSVSGEGSDELVSKALDAGATDYPQDRPGTSHYSLLANRICNLAVRSRDQIERDRTSQRTEARFQLLVETVEYYAIFFLDADGHVQTWSVGETIANAPGWRIRVIEGRDDGACKRDAREYPNHHPERTIQTRLGTDRYCNHPLFLL